MAEICENFGLNDVDLEYGDAEYQNLTNYKLLQQTFKQRIQSGNPKVPQPKLMMLVAAKWREFQALAANANAEAEQEAAAAEEPEGKALHLLLVFFFLCRCCFTFKFYILEEEEAPKRGRGARRSRTSKKVVDEGN